MGQDKEVTAEKPQCSQAQEVVNTFCDENRKKSLKDYKARQQLTEKCEGQSFYFGRKKIFFKSLFCHY